MTRKALLLRMLRDAGPAGVTTHEIIHAGAGARHGPRLRRLREGGHVIRTTRVREGAWRHVLAASAERAPGTSPAHRAALLHGAPAEASLPPPGSPAPSQPTLFEPEPQPLEAALHDFDEAA